MTRRPLWRFTPSARRCASAEWPRRRTPWPQDPAAEVAAAGEAAAEDTADIHPAALHNPGWHRVEDKAATEGSRASVLRVRRMLMAAGHS